jgi:hypothetical protein
MSWDDSSSDDSFFFFGGSSSSGSMSGGAALAWFIILALIFVGIWLYHRHDKDDDRKLAKYIETHQCKLDYFIGGDKTKRAVYQCIDGRMLDFELREKALQ